MTTATSLVFASLSRVWVAFAAAPGAPPPPQTAAVGVALRGQLRTAGTREPIADATVFVLPDRTSLRSGTPLAKHDHVDGAIEPAWLRTAASDERGGFAVEGLVGARVRVVVTAPGFERLEQIVVLPMTDPLKLFVRPDSETAYRTTVTAPASRARPRVTSRLLSPAEIKTLPGTQGDPLRALQNFPGVARPPGGLGVLVLRGAAPNQSQVFYGEHALPRAFHASGISSVIPADAMASIDFQPSNASSRYGETTGGVVAIEPTHLAGTAVHGYGKIDLTGASALAAGPAGKGGFLVAANRGWIDGALRLAQRIENSIPNTAPSYVDYQALYARPLGRGARIEGRILGATDRVQTRYFDPNTNESKVALEVQTQFHRADIVVSKRQDRWRFMFSPSFRVELNRFEATDRSRTQRTDLITSWRAEAEYRASPRAALLVGADSEIDPFRTKVTALAEPSMFNPSLQDSASRGWQTRTGLYATADVRLGPVTLWPGLRFNAYTLGSDAETAADPRFSGRWQISERWAWSFGAGVYSQSVVQQRVSDETFIENITGRIAGGVVLPASFATLEPRAGFDPVTNDVRVARAGQVSTGVQWTPAPAWQLDAAAYGRVRGNADGLTVVTTARGDALRLSPDTYDVGYGLEFIARRMPVGKWYGWLSYTLSRSEVRFLDALQQSARPQNGPFDQRHILAVVGSYSLPKRWRIGGRFRLVSGSPFTDVVGTVEQVASASQAVINGEPNAARFPVFHQLDLRVDKSWVQKRTVVIAYVDVQNVYNHANVEAYIYDFSYQERFSGLGLPIFPSVGVRVEF